MSYANQDDMEKRFGVAEMVQLTDKELSGAFNADVFAQAQLDGDAEIDAYLRPQYVLPLVTVPGNLVRLACDIYRYYLLGDYVTDFVQKRYEQAVSFLKQVQAGKIDLNPGNDGAPAPEEQIHVSKGAEIFTTDRLRNF